MWTHSVRIYIDSVIARVISIISFIDHMLKLKLYINYTKLFIVQMENFSAYKS